MTAYFSIAVRAVLHSLKDLIEALLDPSRHAHLNGLTGMVSTESKIHVSRCFFDPNLILRIFVCRVSLPMVVLFHSRVVVVRIWMLFVRLQRRPKQRRAGRS